MATLVKSFAIQGIDGYRVDIEVTTLDGQPMLGVKIGESYLTIPAACFTVTVAIMVCFFNSQGFARRAHDLEWN